MFPKSGSGSDRPANRRRKRHLRTSMMGSGPGAFTTPGNLGLIFNDGLFGKGVQYVAAGPGAFGGLAPATVVTSFDASADVTGLALNLGSENVGSDINISVNGSALAPLVVSTAFPTAFLGVTDASGPITNITFTVSNFQFPGSQGTVAARQQTMLRADSDSPFGFSTAVTSRSSRPRCGHRGLRRPCANSRRLARERVRKPRP
jgi:hypothetical protein